MKIRKQLLFLLIVLIVSISARIILTNASKKNDYWIDLVIYMDGGKLLIEGIDPYDVWDNVEARDSLRIATSAIYGWLGETQERWDYYSASNLPLSQLLYGTIEYFAKGDPYVYRIVFSLLDSLTSVFIAFFVMTYWNLPDRYKYPIAIGLGALSPILLHMGCVYPEEKGLQILLMIGALHFSMKRRFLLACLFLGLSIAFKALGIFIAPLCLYYFMGSPTSLRQVFQKQNIRIAILFTVASCAFAVQSFIPYIPEVYDMMMARLDAGANSEFPIHGSIWRWFYIWFPISWLSYKLGFTLFFFIINLLLIIRKRATLEVFTASLLLWFLGVTLIAGSLDRMNIGFVIIILLVGMYHIRSAILISLYYVFAGCIVFFAGFQALNIGGFDFEILDAAFTFLFFILYTALIAYHVIKVSPKPSAQNETQHSYSST